MNALQSFFHHISSASYTACMSCLPYARHFDIRRSDVTPEIRVIGNNTCAAEGMVEEEEMKGKGFRKCMERSE